MAVGGNRNVVEPGLESRIKELHPVTSHMEHQGMTEEEVLEAKACSHTTEIEQVSKGRGSGDSHECHQGRMKPRGKKRGEISDKMVWQSPHWLELLKTQGII